MSIKWTTFNPGYIQQKCIAKSLTLCTITDLSNISPESSQPIRTATYNAEYMYGLLVELRTKAPKSDTFVGFYCPYFNSLTANSIMEINSLISQLRAMN